MPFGVTYAAYASSILLALLAQVPDSMQPDQPFPEDQLVFSYGRNAPDKVGIGKGGMYAVELWKAKEFYPGLRPMYSIATDGRVGGYASLTLRKDFQFGDVQVSPYGGVALHQRDWTNYNALELIQYRTGFDISIKVGPQSKLTIGYYHMSNFGISGTSANIDVTRVAFISQF